MTLEKLLEIEEEFIVVQKAFIEAREQYEALSQTLRKAERAYVKSIVDDRYVENNDTCLSAEEMEEITTRRD